MTLEQARSHIGRTVIYMPSTKPGMGPTNVGTIMSVNDTFVFVRYGTASNTAATRPEDIELEVRT